MHHALTIALVASLLILILLVMQPWILARISGRFYVIFAQVLLVFTIVYLVAIVSTPVC